MLTQNGSRSKSFVETKSRWQKREYHPFVEDDGCGEVDRHKWWLGKEEIIEANNVTVVGQDMSEPKLMYQKLTFTHFKLIDFGDLNHIGAKFNQIVGSKFCAPRRTKYL